MAEEIVVADHNEALVEVLKEQTEQGKAALAALKSHSNAGAAGSTVHTAIESFAHVFDKIGHALELHRQAKAAEPTELVADEPSEPAGTGALQDNNPPVVTEEAKQTQAEHDEATGNDGGAALDTKFDERKE